MLDSNAILVMMIVSFLIGFITTAISQNIGNMASKLNPQDPIIRDSSQFLL